MIRTDTCRPLLIAMFLVGTSLGWPDADSGEPVSRKPVSGKPTSENATPEQASLTESISITRLRQMTRVILRDHAAAEALSVAEFDRETLRLANWYVMLRDDNRHSDSQLMQSTTARIRTRLLRWSRDRQKQLRRDGIAPISVSTGELDARIKRALDQSIESLPDAGPVGAAAGGILADGGWQLVELIERIVRPDFWQTQGGPGVVHYFAARRVLVVRATSDVHQDLKDLLTALR